MKTKNEVHLIARLSKDAELKTFSNGGSKASQAARFLKGEMIDVSGRMVTRAYEVNNEKRYTTEVVCWEVKAAEEQSQGEVNGNRVDDDFNY